MVSTDSGGQEPLSQGKFTLEKQRQEETAAEGQTGVLRTPGPRGWATDGSSLALGKEEETPNARQTEASSERASGRQDLLIFLHTAIQYSSDSKLFLLPPQPPYIKRMHFLLLGSKYQRGTTARQGPVIASWEQTAVWRWVRRSASEEHRPRRATYTTCWWHRSAPPPSAHQRWHCCCTHLRASVAAGGAAIAKTPITRLARAVQRAACPSRCHL